MTITPLVTQVGDIERLLRAGRAPRAVANELQEPINDVLVIYHRLRRDGQLHQAPPQPVTPTEPAPPAAPAVKPVHAPSEEAKNRANSATELLIRADGIAVKRVQSALGRARKALTDLAKVVNDHEDQASARAEIARLERQLAAAKAKLRGGAPAGGGSNAAAGVDSKAVRAWCKANGIDCSPVGVLPTAIVDMWRTATSQER